MRSMGVEEELFLVDAGSGEPTNVAAAVIRAATARDEANPAPGDEHGGSLGHEVQKSQIETDTPPIARLDDLEQALRAWRERARSSALEAGARILASGTPPLKGASGVLRTPRFDAMAQRYGRTMAEQQVSGTHVHVDIAGPEEGVAVLDRIRTWLPLLLAVSANSPWWHSADTAYESYRSQVMTRWPSAGPMPVLGSVEAYRAYVDAMLATEVLLDEAMVYSDARLSAAHPTIELRTADVCLDVRDAVLVASLSRALVETAAREWAEGRPPADTGVQIVRLATWKAGRYGLTGDLVDPVSGTAQPAADVMGALLGHVEDALRDAGDLDQVTAGIERLLRDGTGSVTQRRLLDAAETDEQRAQAVLEISKLATTD